MINVHDARTGVKMDFPDNTPEDEIRATFERLEGVSGQPAATGPVINQGPAPQAAAQGQPQPQEQAQEESGGRFANFSKAIMPIAQQLMAMNATRESNGNASPRISGGNVVGLGLQGTENLMARQQQANEDQMARKIQNRALTQKQLEEEKDRQQELKLLAQKQKNAREEAKLRHEQEKELIGEQTQAQIEAAKGTGLLDSRRASAQQTEAETALLPSPEEAAEIRELERAGIDLQNEKQRAYISEIRNRAAIAKEKAEREGQKPQVGMEDFLDLLNKADNAGLNIEEFFGVLRTYYPEVADATKTPELQRRIFGDRVDEARERMGESTERAKKSEELEHIERENERYESGIPRQQEIQDSINKRLDVIGKATRGSKLGRHGQSNISDDLALEASMLHGESLVGKTYNGKKIVEEKFSKTESGYPKRIIKLEGDEGFLAVTPNIQGAE